MKARAFIIKVKRICWDMVFEAFFIDRHAFWQSYQNRAATIGQHYAAAFRLAFQEAQRIDIPAGSDVITAKMLLRSWMDSDDGTTKFRIDTALS